MKKGLNTLERWAEANVMNKAKCKELHLDISNPRNTYKLGGEVFESKKKSETCRALGDNG